MCDRNFVPGGTSYNFELSLAFYHTSVLYFVRALYKMSQEESEDVKPKLNLNITYDGTREAFFFLPLYHLLGC